MKKESSPKLDHKLIIVDEQGHSWLLVGDLEGSRFGKSTEDVLPSYLSVGWRVVKMTAFNDSKRMAVLIEKEVVI